MAREGDLSLAGPALGKILPHPRGDFVFLRSQSAPNMNPLSAQSLQGGTGVRQVIELYEHVHGSGFTFGDHYRDRGLMIPSCAAEHLATLCALSLGRGPRRLSLGQHLVSGCEICIQARRSEQSSS